MLRGATRMISYLDYIRIKACLQEINTNHKIMMTVSVILF
jgi:hypothetical protein